MTGIAETKNITTNATMVAVQVVGINTIVIASALYKVCFNTDKNTPDLPDILRIAP